MNRAGGVPRRPIEINARNSHCKSPLSSEMLGLVASGEKSDQAPDDNYTQASDFGMKADFIAARRLFPRSADSVL